MSDEINRTLGRIEGTLIEFKDNTDRRFDEIHAAAKLATKTAQEAQDKAEEAHAFAKMLVQKAGFMGAVVSFVVFGIISIIEHIPRALATITGSH